MELEHGISNPRVAGSSPARDTQMSNKCIEYNKMEKRCPDCNGLLSEFLGKARIAVLCEKCETVIALYNPAAVCEIKIKE